MTVIEERRPRARKAHACEVCARAIPEGERYVWQRVVDGRDAWTYRAHEACHNRLARFWIEVYGLTRREAFDVEELPDRAEFRVWLDGQTKEES